VSGIESGAVVLDAAFAGEFPREMAGVGGSGRVVELRVCRPLFLSCCTIRPVSCVRKVYGCVVGCVRPSTVLRLEEANEARVFFLVGCLNRLVLMCVLKKARVGMKGRLLFSKSREHVQQQQEGRSDMTPSPCRGRDALAQHGL